MVAERQKDAIIIGGGPNGLACAAYLARAGKRVIIVEAQNDLGGGTRSSEFIPGYVVPGCAHHISHLSKHIIKDLKLSRYGLRLATRHMPLIALDAEGQHINLSRRVGRKNKFLLENSADAAAYQKMSRHLQKTARVLRAILETDEGEAALPRGFKTLFWRLRSKEARYIENILNDLALPLGDYLDTHMQNAALKGALACVGAMGVSYGPRERASLYHLLYQLAGSAEVLSGDCSFPHKGPRDLTAALAESAVAAGAEIRTGARVARILVDGNSVQGVVLADGSRLLAQSVISSLPPAVTYGELIGYRYLPTHLTRRLRARKITGICGKLHLALEALPDFRNLSPQDYGGRLIIAPDIDYVERAVDAPRRGEFAIEPAMEIIFPSCHDASLARSGHHVLSANIIGIPYDVDGGWAVRRDECVKSILDVMALYAPDIKDKIIGGDFLTPADIETRFGMPGGDWHHGGQALRAFGFRPSAKALGLADISGLDLCGAGSHPGGNVSCLPGFFAARRALQGKADA